MKEGSFKFLSEKHSGGGGGQEREAERRTATSRFPQEQQVNIIH